MRFARTLAAELARAGVAVLSGGALGIDTEAHLGALQARGVTGVIAPAGFESPYPPENQELFERILQRGGAYASLVEDHVSATRAAFFARNACLAALAWATVVVQAGFRSGARNAACAARRLGRPLFAVPWSPFLGKGQGCLAELRLGARLCERTRDVLEVLESLGAHPIPPAPARRRARRPRVEALQQLPFDATLDEAELASRITNCVARGARNIDEVAVLAGLPVAAVNRVLLTLRLQGVLVSAASGQLSLLKSSD